MVKLGSVLVLCVTFVTSAVSETCNETPSCSIFPNQDRGVVTLQSLTQKVQSKHWIMIYYTQFSSTQTYGKCNFRWHAPNSDQNVKRELMCYNFDLKECEDYERLVKRKTSDCSRGEENGVNTTMDAKFYSQDLDHYFWYDSCYEYDSDNKCTTRYLDLLVSKTRYSDSDDSELDLQGLPWHLIASDLKYHFNMDMSDDKMKFSWKGPECGFDGKLIETSGTGSVRQNILALFIAFSLYSLLF
ncbi:uncharacterized protein LOC132715799 [Ruditapes philippinarum]|uniref:uncharacterized protein LOC132715799 n=1 Tax=Ruditapes philippinarum TaxID=129788 RepID=UPI00295B0FB1|nr:uncharacterized protein LOC132715799 [Ruditapes philippinarum]